MQSILACADMGQPQQRLTLKGRLVSLLSEITLLQSNHTREPESGDKRVHDVLAFLGEHLKEELGLEDLSWRFNISKNYLNTLFRQATGTTVKQYVRIKRLGLVRQELTKGANLEEAAYKAGFNNYSNFYRAYKSFYGSMPSTQRTNKGARDKISLIHVKHFP